MKQLTLSETWVLCLRMWRWIAKEWEKDLALPESERREVFQLKNQWINANRLKSRTYCFFCKYAIGKIGSCDGCPGALVDPKFACYHADYNYETNPPAFYAELLRLNRIRKGKK